MTVSPWDLRITRAETLARDYSFATEILWFYARIATLQKDLSLHLLPAESSGSPFSFGKALPVEFPYSKLGEFLSKIESFAPQTIAWAARELKARGEEGWQDLLTSIWQKASYFELKADDATTLIAWMFLQPFAENVAERASSRAASGSSNVCPVCSAKPLVGVLRPEGDGGKRSLICSVCSTEWPYRRIVCVACGEESVDKLAVYTAEQFKHVRLEACDTCRYYIKTVDLTSNGRAVPIVDELATIPLNLWAQEHEYKKLRGNLLGI